MRLCYSAWSCQKVLYFNYFRNIRLVVMIPEQQSFPQKVILFNYFIFSVQNFNLLFCFFFTGRLYQVEYAMEAISHAGTCLGILANDGILLTAERKNTNKLLDGAIFSEKIYKLNE